MSTARPLPASQRYPVVRERLLRRSIELSYEVAELRELIEYYDDHGRCSSTLQRQLEVAEQQRQAIERLMA